MAILTIRRVPDAILKTPTRSVQAVTLEIRTLARDMIDTMYAAGGVGLSANQVGHPWRLFVANPEHRRGHEVVLINPVIVSRRGRARLEEGCLSLPGIAAVVPRWTTVCVEGTALDEKACAIEGQDLLARIFQHEIDHLNGRLFVDRLPFVTRYRLLRRYHRQQQEVARVSR